MPIITFNQKEYEVPQGTCLREWMTAAALALPCGGKGVCGQCKVMVRGAVSPVSEEERGFLTASEIADGVRLACYTHVAGDCTVESTTPSSITVCTDAVSVYKHKSGFCGIGAVVDVGTTTIAVALYDGDRRIAEAAAANPQAVLGTDVIARIQAAVEGKSELLSTLVRDRINQLLEQAMSDAAISADKLTQAVITGNTVMLSLLTDTAVDGMAVAPFHVRRLFGETVTPAQCGLQRSLGSTPVYLPRCTSAFLGADLTCALHFCNLCGEGETALLIDVGTNGEIALWHKGELYLCSTAAGPAFEGGGLSCGMPACEGAIDRVSIVNGHLVTHTIGGGRSVGICGSGLVDAIACLLDLEELDINGAMDQPAYAIAENVCLTHDDVQALQVAKSAIRAGVETLLQAAHATAEDIEVLYLAGGFGAGLRPVSVGRIGLFPPTLVSRVCQCGNAALAGASLLLDRKRRDTLFEVFDTAHIVNLATDPYFADVFIRYMQFPSS